MSNMSHFKGFSQFKQRQEKKVSFRELNTITSFVSEFVVLLNIFWNLQCKYVIHIVKTQGPK